MQGDCLEELVGLWTIEENGLRVIEAPGISEILLVVGVDMIEGHSLEVWKSY